MIIEYAPRYDKTAILPREIPARSQHRERTHRAKRPPRKDPRSGERTRKTPPPPGHRGRRGEAKGTSQYDLETRRGRARKNCPWRATQLEPPYKGVGVWKRVSGGPLRMYVCLGSFVAFNFFLFDSVFRHVLGQAKGTSQYDLETGRGQDGIWQTN